MITRESLRGTVLAAGFLIDPELLGADEARRRVLAHWRPGCRLLQAADGWLLVLAEPESVRAERAPGTPVTSGPSGRSVEIERHGAQHRIALDELAPVSMVGWLSRRTFAVHRLTPCELPAPEPDAVPSADIPVPDLRVLAGVSGSAEQAAAQFVGRGGSPRSERSARSRRRLAVVAVVAVLIVVVLQLLRPAGGHGGNTPSSAPATVRPAPSTVTFPAAGGSGGSGGDVITLPPPVAVPSLSVPATPELPSPGLIALLLASVVVLVFVIRAIVSGYRSAVQQARAAASPAAATRPRKRRGVLARLLLRSPARNMIGRRHLRYLQQLTRDFDDRNWDAALRTAIGLSGGGRPGQLTLRLPKPRDGLGFGVGGAGSSMYFGDTVFEHLRKVYLDAAADLEQRDRSAEAAFVHGELLGDTRTAVAVLERAGMIDTAAELATARRLDPALLVRLWWRAGNRTSAIDVARVRGAFDEGIRRLAEVDPAEARALRIAWVEACQHAGDDRGAMHAAWPDAELRSLVADTLLARDPSGAGLPADLLARVVVASGSTTAFETALQLTGSADPIGVAARDELAAALAGTDGVAAADPVQDRRLCSAVLLAQLRDGGTAPGVTAKQARRQAAALRRRADPLLVADLPTSNRRPSLAHGVVQLRIGDIAGSLRVHDAAALPDGRILLAAGSRGTLLLAASGRVSQRWDRPAERLVLADGAGSALLMQASSLRTEISRLDLRTGRITFVGTVITRGFPDSYDGAVLTLIADDGIEVVDVLSSPPRVLWTELDRQHPTIAIARTPTRLAALVRSGDEQLQLCTWRLPDMTMALRNTFDAGRISSAAVIPDQALVVDHASTLGPRLRRVVDWKVPETERTRIGQSAFVASSGGCTAVHQQRADGGVQLLVADADRVIADVVGAADEPLWMRATEQTITVWGNGCVLAIETCTGTVTASARVTA